MISFIKKFIITSTLLIFIGNMSVAQFTIYTQTNSGLPDNFVFVSKMDSKNNLWIGTQNGLARKSGNTWTVFNTLNSNLTSDWIQTIEIVDTNEIWIGTVGFTPGLFKYNGISIVKYDSINGKATPSSIYALKKDNNGNLWIGGGFTSFKFDGTNLIDLDLNGPLYINSFALRNGTLWAGSYAYGVYKYNGSVWTNYNMSNSNIPSNYMERVCIDTNNVVWMGGFGSSSEVMGLTKFDGINWTNYNTTNSNIPRNPIYDIVIDKSNVKWIANGDGNNPGGLVKFNDTTFQLTNTLNSNIPTNIILDLNIDNFNRLYLSTYAFGICYFQIPSIITSVETISKTEFINIYPQPATKEISIDFSTIDLYKNTRLKMIDMLGNQIKNIEINSKITVIDIRKYKSGIYAYQLYNADGIINTGKIIIE